MYICGLLNGANKDSGAAVLRSSEVPGELPEYVAISEERLSRVKNAYFAPVRSIRYCMDAFGLKDMSEIDYFVMDWGDTPRFLNSTRSYRKLENDYIMSKLNVPPEKMIIAESHHFAHAVNAYFPAQFEEAAILVVDGLGSNMETTSLFKGEGKKIEFIENSRHFGVGELYTTVTEQLLGFGVAEEGKTMGLAPYGEEIRQRILHFDSRYEGVVTDYSRFMNRAPDSSIRQPGVVPCRDRSKVTDDYYARIAFEVQEEIEKAIIHLVRYAIEKTGSRNLCLSGGTTLNCVANSIILESGLVEKMFVQPAASDTGIPFGLAIIGYYQKSKVKEKIPFRNAYTGRSYPLREIKSLLSRFNIPGKEASPMEVAGLLADGYIVGWFCGGSEYGPRALGHRSILTDPRDPEMKNILNEKVKHREKYRPFSPSVLEEKAQEYFRLNNHTSPFMLLAPKAEPKAWEQCPAVVHVDKTSRVQTVSKEESVEYYELIRAFGEITNVPVILNTSFNDSGEPIVETALDALICFIRTHMDYLVLDGILVSKSQLDSNKERLLLALNDYRDKILLEEYKSSLELCCNGYNTKEMVSYLFQENEKCAYHAKHRALDQIEDKLTEWALTGQRVAVICDRYHKDLMRRIAVFHKVNVEATIEIADDLISAEEADLSKTESADTALVFTYNSAFYLVKRMTKEFKGEVFTPYSNFSQKLPADILMPIPEAKPNDFTDLDILSFEAQRNKDWDKFFATGHEWISKEAALK